ncbi:glycosyltransferase family 61 protein [Algoriphagus sp.]|uniref:glycosyltransferase family 61 protein n=1 Tax=Algoriphagus sp. TaxID=1872435 RepID=UPI00391BDF93
MIKQLLLKFKSKTSLLLSQFLDSKVWEIQEENDKIEVLHFSSHKDQILNFYSEDFLKKLFFEAPAKHKFILHIYSSYVYKLENTILEPSQGWIILSKYFVFKFSFPLVEDPWRPKPILPSYIKFALGLGKSSHIDEAISLRYGWENYYHFFIDVLGQISILESKGVPSHIPILVPYYFGSIPFVQEFLKLSSFIKRKLIVQKKNEYYHVKKLIVSKDSFISEGVKDVVHSVDHLRELDRNDKIFIYRPKVHGRAIINNDEIIQIAESHGFIPVDPSSLTLKDQIVLFSGASHIIGIHGAGLTNIIFRCGLSLSLFEIFPDESLTPEHYRNLSNYLSFNYKSIIGEKSDEKYNFYLDPSIFKNNLKQFC